MAGIRHEALAWMASPCVEVCSCLAVASRVPGICLAQWAWHLPRFLQPDPDGVVVYTAGGAVFNVRGSFWWLSPLAFLRLTLGLQQTQAGNAPPHQCGMRFYLIPGLYLASWL